MANSDYSTEMQYQIVRDGVTNIINKKNRLESIMNDFEASMNRTLSPDAFKGIAADAVSGDYQTFKNQFTEILGLLQDFADSYSNAATTMEQHEQALKNQTSALNQDLTRM